MADKTEVAEEVEEETLDMKSFRCAAALVFQHRHFGYWHTHAKGRCQNRGGTLGMQMNAPSTDR